MADSQTSDSNAAHDPGTTVPRPSSRAQAFRETLFELIRLDGVRGGLIVTPDGLVITSELPPRFPVEALAALAATLGRELELGASRLERAPSGPHCSRRTTGPSSSEAARSATSPWWLTAT